MSVDFSKWMSSSQPINAQSRAVDAWRRIQRKPVSVVFTKPQVTTGGVTTPATALPAQWVRIDSDNRASAVQGIAGLVPKRIVLIYGVVGHPDPAVVNNDIREGYTFKYEGDQYRVLDPIPGTPGVIQVQAITT